MLRPLNYLNRFIFETPFWLFVLSLWVLMVFKSGLAQAVPLDPVVSLAISPFENIIGENFSHYIFFTWLAPFLMWCLSIDNEDGVLYFSFFFTILYTLLFFFTARRFLPDKLARISLLIFASISASSTVYFWICPDSLTLFLMLLALVIPFQKMPWAIFIIGALLGLQDFEKIVIGAAALAFATHFSQKDKDAPKFLYSPTFALTLILGAVFGKLLLTWIIYYFDIQIDTNRFDWIGQYFMFLLSSFFKLFQHSFYSCLGVGWLVVFYVIFNEKYGKWFGLMILGCFFILTIALDHTRIFAMITFLLMAQFILFNRALLEKFTPQIASIYFAIWLIAPFEWVLMVKNFSMASYNIFSIFINYFGWNIYVPS